jgi:hypothetical protein
MSRKLILYGLGGLCNRLRPMASAIEIAHKFDRELLIFWTKEPHCPLPFQDLFDARGFNVINADQFRALGYDYNLPTLMPDVKAYQKDMSIKYSWPEERKMLASSQENILYMSNNFDPSVERESHRNLKERFFPIRKIADKIDDLVFDLGLSKETIGIHARGTDMSGVSYKWYADQAHKWNGTHRLFLSTECPSLMTQFSKDFPDILTAPDTVYATKQQPGAWKYNLNISEEAMVHSVIDLFLLAHTSIKVAWPHSTFAKVARIIGEDF